MSGLGRTAVCQWCGREFPLSPGQNALHPCCGREWCVRMRDQVRREKAREKKRRQRAMARERAEAGAKARGEEPDEETLGALDAEWIMRECADRIRGMRAE